MKKVLFLDFEDSFTHNVVQELKREDIDIEIIHWRDTPSVPSHDLLVLGPGPGHPLDYQIIFPFIQGWIDSEKKIFGVCLGHQLFWTLKGERVVKSRLPLHGQRTKLRLPVAWQNILNGMEEVSVQRYNSLCVEESGFVADEGNLTLFQEGELQMAIGASYITYQFHPESVGTKCRRVFFELVHDRLL